ncbi:hypothetical protein [Cupriavidus basilensis]|uniref:hypothetical protein n=1 Tax=Cupriavidus basilensis TaxID=68895 RepID=UPI0003132789|nr:hypothetical protein [Cupriavidus basilensis]
MTTDYRPDFHACMLKAYDVDEQAENLSHWDQRYTQISPGRFEGALTEAWIGKIQIFRETINQVVRAEGQMLARLPLVLLSPGDGGTGLSVGR